ncbi:hypothetical protein C8T65DRAFT_269057 [Cerioporus squamosus]|nr:hypothetical protein C8T65DRAFT_269057 [Cerioporus squamosus]
MRSTARVGRGYLLPVWCTYSDCVNCGRERCHQRICKMGVDENIRTKEARGGNRCVLVVYQYTGAEVDQIPEEEEKPRKAGRRGQKTEDNTGGARRRVEGPSARVRTHRLALLISQSPKNSQPASRSSSHRTLKRDVVREWSIAQPEPVRWRLRREVAAPAMYAGEERADAGPWPQTALSSVDIGGMPGRGSGNRRRQPPDSRSGCTDESGRPSAVLARMRKRGSIEGLGIASERHDAYASLPRLPPC